MTTPLRALSTVARAIAAVAVLCWMAFPANPTFSQGRPTDTPRAAAGEVLVQFHPGVTREARGRARGRARATFGELVASEHRRSDGKGDLELVRIPPGLAISAAARAIEADDAVEFAEPNFIYQHQLTTRDPYYTDGSLWGMYGDATAPANRYGSQAGEAWARGRAGSRTVYVGIIDEGVQFTHRDLDANVWRNPFDPDDGRDNDGNGYVDDARGWDFVANNKSVYDGGTTGSRDNHGTHVAGTIAAEGTNGSGVAGVNWYVTYISAKFLGTTGGTLVNAVKAVNYFTDLKKRHGLDIVATNNSWGGGGYSRALLDAIAAAAREDILFVAAAGNGGGDAVGDNNDAAPYYPSSYDTTSLAGYDAVISVAAIRSNGGLAAFSNFGAKSVDLGAPGAGVYSTVAYNRYASYSGTSMATPHVTGGIALYAATRSERGAALKAAILRTTVPTPSLAGKTTTGGRLNISSF